MYIKRVFVRVLSLKTQNPFNVYENVIEAPTYNIEHLYK